MIELPIAAKFTGCDLWQPVSSKTLRKAGHKVLAIGRPIFSLLLKLHDVRWIDISGHRDPNLSYRDGTGRL